ncbi:hypothetical protein WICMUC_001125 [Wickerhamomyces mucosus]|uniref:EH domain-containing protein n=1 Tax=Wickerhamomyces mucosus TaxID=1378264 RepID=A0A9P8PVX3_9ASCO|nr:hypothetical protein WICMUC_001125 [Wickerhamomyces mucosus]
MGLLRRKNHQPTVSALQSKNPTGLPSATPNLDQNAVYAKSFAAQAAALTFQRPVSACTEPTLNHPVLIRPSSTSSASAVPTYKDNESLFSQGVTIVKPSSTANSKRSVSNHLQPNSYSSIPHSQSSRSINSNINNEKGSLKRNYTVTPRSNSKRYSGLHDNFSIDDLSLDHQNIKINHLLNPSIQGHFDHVPKPTEKSISPLQMANSAASFAARSFSDHQEGLSPFSKPQLLARANASNSSFSGSIVSSDSYESSALPGSTESFVKQFKNNRNRNRASNGSTIGNSFSTGIDIGGVFEGFDYDDVKPPSRPLSAQGRNLSGASYSSNEIDLIPTIVEERNNKTQSILYPLPIKSTHTNDIEGESLSHLKPPSRKPPPESGNSSPNLLSPPTIFEGTPVQKRASTSISVPLVERSGSTKRSSSPKRKPPPDLLQGPIKELNGSYVSLNSKFNDNHNNNSDVEDEELPQYPTIFPSDGTYTSTHSHHRKLSDPNLKHHHRPHGFRKNAKHIFKKGLKSAGYGSGSSHTYKDLSNTDYDTTSTELHHISKPVQLKTTMRKESTKDRINEAKPWKHHNDREYITEQERKRYEGVWVSNKGLYLEYLDEETLFKLQDTEEEVNPALKASKISTNVTEKRADLSQLNFMLNIVVKELWSRSRLPFELLSQIYDLVDTRKDGVLDKKSFIVGMWYVDQCLYGRRLPKQVSELVWKSVNHQLGVNVVLKPKKKK